MYKSVATREVIFTRFHDINTQVTMKGRDIGEQETVRKILLENGPGIDINAVYTVSSDSANLRPSGRGALVVPSSGMDLHSCTFVDPAGAVVR